MMKFRFGLSLIAVLLTALFLTSCFAGADGRISHSGGQGGFYYLYLEDQQLLLINGNGTLTADNIAFKGSYTEKVEFLFLSFGIDTVTEDALKSLTSLKAVYAASEPKGLKKSESESRKIYLNVDDFESTEYIAPGFVLGHCPSNIAGKCLCCGSRYAYDYEELYAFLIYDEMPVSDRTVRTEGSEKKTDSKGMILADGFMMLEGEMRFFKENRMITGSMDLDGFRYTFNKDGTVSSCKKLDDGVPASSVILIVSAIPIGVLGCFLVWKIYKKRAKQEK